MIIEKLNNEQKEKRITKYTFFSGRISYFYCSQWREWSCGVEAIYESENVWLTQKMMGVLYDVETNTINYHLKKIFSDSELEENSVIRNFRITAADGKNYNTNHYNLSAIIAVGYKVNSERAVQFRKWAIGVIKEYTVKAYVMDDERLKNDGSIVQTIKNRTWG